MLHNSRAISRRTSLSGTLSKVHEMGLGMLPLLGTSHQGLDGGDGAVSPVHRKVTSGEFVCSSAQVPLSRFALEHGLNTLAPLWYTENDAYRLGLAPLPGAVFAEVELNPGRNDKIIPIVALEPEHVDWLLTEYPHDDEKSSQLGKRQVMVLLLNERSKFSVPSIRWAVRNKQWLTPGPLAEASSLAVVGQLHYVHLSIVPFLGMQVKSDVDVGKVTCILAEPATTVRYVHVSMVEKRQAGEIR